MIIWVDGANGVGKSHVAMELAEIFTNKNAEYIESEKSDFPNLENYTLTDVYLKKNDDSVILHVSVDEIKQELERTI